MLIGRFQKMNNLKCEFIFTGSKGEERKWKFHTKEFYYLFDVLPVPDPRLPGLEVVVLHPVPSVADHLGVLPVSAVPVGETEP